MERRRRRRQLCRLDGRSPGARSKRGGGRAAPRPGRRVLTVAGCLAGRVAVAPCSPLARRGRILIAGRPAPGPRGPLRRQEAVTARRGGGAAGTRAGAAGERRPAQPGRAGRRARRRPRSKMAAAGLRRLPLRRRSPAHLLLLLRLFLLLLRQGRPRPRGSTAYLGVRSGAVGTGHRCVSRRRPTSASPAPPPPSCAGTAGRRCAGAGPPRPRHCAGAALRPPPSACALPPHSPRPGPPAARLRGARPALGRPAGRMREGAGGGPLRPAPAPSLVWRRRQRPAPLRARPLPPPLFRAAQPVIAARGGRCRATLPARRGRFLSQARARPRAVASKGPFEARRRRGGAGGRARGRRQRIDVPAGAAAGGSGPAGCPQRGFRRPAGPGGRSLPTARPVGRALALSRRPMVPM